MRKIGELRNRERAIKICLDENAKRNPYKIYQVWYNMGKHQRLLDAYGDFNSVVCWINENMWEGKR